MPKFTVTCELNTELEIEADDAEEAKRLVDDWYSILIEEGDQSALDGIPDGKVVCVKADWYVDEEELTAEEAA
jgi:hypothetical protein